MSNRFHSKYHRHNHHTSTNGINPDAGHDPIASPESPFLGDFILKGALSAYNSTNTYGGCFYGSDSALVACGGHSLKGYGNACIVGDLLVTGSINSNSVQTSAGALVLPPTYCFGTGMTESVGSQFNTVSLNIDNSTLVLDNSQRVSVAYKTFYDSLCSLSTLSDTSGVQINMYGNVNYYDFDLGLQAVLKCSSGGTSTYSVSAKVDNSTIVYNEQGALSLASTYTFGAGLSSNSFNNTVNAYVDSCTVKLNNSGQIAGNYCFNGINSGLTLGSTTNSVSANVDGISVLIKDGKIVSGYTIGSSSGLVCSAGTTTSLPNLAVKVDNSTVRINESTGQLETFGLLKTNLPSTQTQLVGGNVSFTGVVSAQNITFKDGTVLETSFNSRPTITNLGTHLSNLQTGVVTTSDNRILAWGANSHLAPGTNRTKVWPPISLPFNDNYLLKNLQYNIKVKEVVHTAHVTMALLTDGTVWAMGYNTAGMLGVNQTYPDPKTGAPVHYARLFQFFKVAMPDNLFIEKIVVASSYNENLKRVEAAFGAITDTGRAFVWGFNYRNMFGAPDYSGALYGQVVTTPVTPQGTSGPFMSGVKKIYFSFEADPIKISGITYNASSNTLPFWKGSCHILKNNGTIFASGLNRDYQLGVGVNAQDTDWRKEIRGFVQCLDGDPNSGNAPLTDIIDIVNGNHYHWQTTFLLTSARQIKVAGLNGPHWALGSLLAQNVSINKPTLDKDSVYNSFVTIPDLNNVLEFKVSGGGGATGATIGTATFTAITTDGFYGWGSNNAGQLTGDYSVATSANNVIKVPTKITAFGSGAEQLGIPVKIVPSRVVNNTNGYHLLGVITSNGFLHLAGYKNPVQYFDFVNFIRPSSFRTVPIANVVRAEFCADATGSNINGILIQDIYSRVFLYCLEANSAFSGGSTDFVYPPTDFSTYLA
jgi:alpha-tubulin suppressor-like RCC1 family protein